jgi:O-acetyl-ADP-ribose deacetylase (regulator of RNase III)
MDANFMTSSKTLEARSRMATLEGDITELDVDAIVNAANARLSPGGGVDGAIRRAAGPNLNIDLQRYTVCAPGSAIITAGHNLPAKFVVHTVAPIWGTAKSRDELEETLACCYESSLRLADAKGIKTIAFPALGTGAFRWPADLAADIAFGAVDQHLREGGKQDQVIFCCYNRADFERYSRLLSYPIK